MNDAFSRCSFRGTMLTSMIFASMLGQTLGAHLEFKLILGFVILLNLIAGISFYFIPDTPLFLIKRNELQVRITSLFSLA